MKRSTILKISAVVSCISGIAIIIGTLYPILSYEALSREKYPNLISPVPDEKNPENSDYTKASNWFLPECALNPSIV